MTDKEIIEHMNVEEFDDEEFIEMGLTAKITHWKGNGGEEPNKHAVIVGEDVIVLKSKE